MNKNMNKKSLATELKKLGISTYLKKDTNKLFVRRSDINKVLSSFEARSGTKKVGPQTFTVNYNNNEYDVEMYAVVDYDPNYGADADNRRGVPMHFIDDFEDVSVLTEDEGLLPEDLDEIEKLACKEAEEFPWSELYSKDA